MTIEEKKSYKETDERQECIDGQQKNNDERKMSLISRVDKLSLKDSL